jgi:hypothetical protein
MHPVTFIYVKKAGLPYSEPGKMPHIVPLVVSPPLLWLKILESDILFSLRAAITSELQENRASLLDGSAGSCYY